MTQYVKISDESETVKFTTQDDGTLSHVTILSQFPDVIGLRYDLDGNQMAVTLLDGKFHPPKNEWTDRTYQCVFRKIKRIHQAESTVGELLCKRPRINFPPEYVFSRFLGIMDKSYFLDKSKLIEALILRMFGGTSDTSIFKPERISLIDPVLLTAPRRFGKTTNLLMIGAFFSGFLPQDKLKLLNVSETEAKEWYGKFAVIYVTFGLSDGDIKSKDDAMNASRNIVHEAFKDYAFLLPYLDESRSESFKKWLDEVEYKNKDKNSITLGLKFLVECMRIRYGYKRKCLLLIDEFDRLSSNALLEASGNELDCIVDTYSDMVGAAIKHSVDSANCYGIFTGVTSLTSKIMSSLNNMKTISVLTDEKFAPFYGFTTDEFNNILSRPTFSAQIKDLEVSYYNETSVEKFTF